MLYVNALDVPGLQMFTLHSDKYIKRLSCSRIVNNNDIAEVYDRVVANYGLIFKPTRGIHIHCVKKAIKIIKMFSYRTFPMWRYRN